jgi:hypothetical protein
MDLQDGRGNPKVCEVIIRELNYKLIVEELPVLK